MVTLSKAVTYQIHFPHSLQLITPLSYAHHHAELQIDVDIDPVSLYSMPFPLIINGPFTPCSDNFSGPFFFKEEMVTLWNSHFQVCFDPPTKP